MTACVSCRLYLLRDALKNLISRETEGRARCQNFSNASRNKFSRQDTHPFIIYLIDLIYYIPNRSTAK